MSRRALFIAPDMRIGGAEQHWLSLVPALRSRGFAVRLVCLQGRGRLHDDMVRSGTPVRVLTSRTRAGEVWSLLGEVTAGPDVVVSRGFNGHAAGWAVAGLSRAVHVLNWHRQTGRLTSSRQQQILRTCARAGNHVIVVSSAQEAELRALGFGPSQLHVIPNGVPARQPRREVATADLTVVLVANLRPEKRVDLFIEAIAMARAEWPQIRGVVCGDGPERENLEARAAALKCAIEFLGHRNDVPSVLSDADALCLTSEAEALPMVILEAMAAGLPVIATDVGGVREAVTDGLTGYLVPTGDRGAIARSLVGLARDREKAARMGRAGRSRQLADFSLDGMLDRYATLLGTLAR